MTAREAKQKEILSGRMCHMDAQRNARYGRKDWIVWVDRNENKFAARLTYDTLKRAMLANGTKGRDYWVYMGGSGNCWGMFWQQAITFLANLKRGYM